MRLFHSFWSRPALETVRWRIKGQYPLSLIHTALSVAYAKSLGLEIALHTDKAGKALLDCLPYDEITLDLEGSKAPLAFWASGKLLAMKSEPLNAAHIDTDFWIKDKKLLDFIASNEIVFSHRESTEKYRDSIAAAKRALEESGAACPFTGNEEESINMGLAKVANPQLRKAFFHEYWRLAYFLSRNAHYMSNCDRMQKNGLNIAGAPDLVAEQLLMSKLVERSGAKAAYLIGKEEAKSAAGKEIGFCHLLSFDKYIKIPQELKRLKETDPAIYRRVLEKYDEIGFKILNVEL
jgi:hypothetical protein